MEISHANTDNSTKYRTPPTEMARKYLREAAAILFWSFSLIKLFIFDIDTHIFQPLVGLPDWIFNAKPFIILISISILWSILGHMRFIKFCLFMLFYPLIFLLYRIPRLLLSYLWIILPLYPLLSLIIIKIRLTLFLYCMVAISAIYGLANNDRNSILLAMAGIAIFIVIYSLQIVICEFRPNIFKSLIDSVNDIRRKVKNGDLEKIAESDSEQTNIPIGSRHSATNQRLLNIYLSYHITQIAYKIISDVRSKKRYEIYSISRLFYIILIISLAFSFEYRFLYRIDNKSFAHVTNPTFIEFYLFSLDILIPQSISDIVPVSYFAKSMTIIASIYSWSVIAIVIMFMLFGSNREAFNSGIKDFIAELRLLIDDIDKRLSDTYATNINSLELHLLGVNSFIVNKIRKARGLSEIENPSAPEIIKPMGVPTAEKRQRSRRYRNGH